MAVIRTPTELNDPVSYVATLAFFCCVSCMVMMLKFRGFKASLNLSSWRKKDAELEPTLAMTGAYRINRDEFYGNGNSYEPPKKLTPSMVKLPPSFDPQPELRPTKSTSDLARPATVPAHLQQHRSTYDVSQDPRGAPSRSQNNERSSAPPVAPERRKKAENTQEKEQRRIEKQKLAEEKEQKRIEKQKLAEEKAREKAAALEQAKQEKLRQKQAAQEQAKVIKKKKKKVPVPPQAQTSNPLAMSKAPAPPAPPSTNQSSTNIPQPYSTNMLDSSISRSSGPPPYSEAPIVAGNSNPGNVSFGKPIEAATDSWDLISQHRQQMMTRLASPSVQPRAPRKNMVMDLQYKLGPAEDKENSEA